MVKLREVDLRKLAGSLLILLTILFATFYLVSNPSPRITLNGAGSSFVNPLMSSWADDYHLLHPDIRINYASIGSGGGIQQLISKTVDFGASDAPLNREEFEAIGNPLHLPVTVGGVVVAYNLPGVGDGLRLNGSVLADIFLGKITTWDDPQIQTLNPGVSLPSKNILVVHRSDGSGTTFVFSDYLSHVSNEWKENVGTGKSLSWPTGIGGKGNEGVTAAILGNEYSIGYTELSYAITNQLNTVALENQVGEFIQADNASIQAAVDNSAASLPRGQDPWENVTLVNAPGSGSYPISSFVYVLIYQDLNNVASYETAQTLVDFLWYIIHDGQALATPLYYVPLASSVVAINEQTLGLVTYKGQTLELPSSAKK